MQEWLAFEARYQLKPVEVNATQKMVYRGVFRGTPATVKLATSTPQALSTFRREAALLGLLRDSLAPVCFEVGEVGQQVFLSMERIEGRSLQAHWKEGEVWTARRVVLMACDILRLLVLLHRNGYVHRDIKPENIIIDGEGRAHLIDFHSALHRQAHVEEEAQDVGTLAYCAPEQTRMLVRPLGPRADLYALGVVMFEGLTGRLPFTAETIEELALMHASQAAPRLDTIMPEVSPFLVMLLERLLAKEPHERYFRTESLLLLLRKFEREGEGWDAGESEREILRSKGGQRGSLDGLPFVGREGERGHFQEVWSRVQRRHEGALVLVEAAPGMGKSRLSQEFLRQAAPEFGISVKCVRGATIPLAPWRTALEQCWTQLQALPDGRREKLEARFREDLLSYASLLLTLAPSWGALWPGLLDSSSSVKATRELFYTMLSDLWLRILEGANETVLLIDDVQWMDLGSLEIVKRLVRQWKDVPLCVIATSRNDPESIDGLSSFRAVCGDVISGHFVLGELTRENAHGVCREFLATAPPASLEDYLWERSQGNPFALQQYLKILIEEGVLWPSEGRWHFAQELVASLSLPQDIVGLLLRRFKQLSPMTIDVLHVVATLGYRGRFSLLRITSPFGEQALSQALSEAMESQLMSRDGELYQFVHDRIHEACLFDLAPEKRREYHRHIAQSLEGEVGLSGEWLYACALHYLAGQRAGDQAKVAEICLRAGKAALEAYSEQEAHTFLEGALKARREDGAGGNVPAELYYHLAVAGFRLGKLEQAHQHLRCILEASREPLIRARAHHLIAELYIIDYKPNQAEGEMSQAFRELKVSPPASGVWGLLSILYAWGMGLWMRYTGWGVGAAVGEEAERKRLLVALYETSSRISFFQMNDFKFLQGLFPMFHIAHQLGESAYLVRAYNAFCLFKGVMSSPKGVLAYRDLALAHAKGDPPLIARTHIYAHWGLNFTGKDPCLTEKFQDALSSYGHLMDPFEWANCNAVLEMALYTHGYMEEAEKVALQSIEQLKANNEEITNHRALHGPMHSLAIARFSLGKFAQAQQNYEEAQALLKLESDSAYTQCWSLGASALMYLERHEFGESFEAICEEHKRYKVVPGQAPIFLRFFFAYQALGRLQQSLGASPDVRVSLRPVLEAARKALKGTTNRPFFLSFLAFVEGGMAYLEGDLPAARERLEKALKLALDWDNPMLMCETLFLQARLFREQGLLRQGRLASEQAYALASRHRWHVRMGRILQVFPLAKVHAFVEDARSFSSSTQTMKFSSLRFKRHMNALLQINLASAVTREPTKRAHAILEQLVELLGAERARLFVLSEQSAEAPASLELVASQYAKSFNGIEPQALSLYDQEAIEQVVQTRQPTIYPPKGQDFVRDTRRIRSIIAAPLLMQEQLRGVVYLDSHLVSGLFCEEDVEILQALANHIAIAMASADASDSLARARDRALDASRAKSLFLATMSHELRTPLNVIIGYTELIGEELEEIGHPALIQDVESILEAARGLLGIIEDVLTLTDLETERFVLQTTTFNLHEFVQALVQEISPAVERLGTRVELQLPPQPAELHSDRRKCRHILFHILQNAVRFTRGGEVRLVLKQEDTGWRFCIEDDGDGMDEQTLARIFEPFYQADMTHSREFGGAGMGLAIAQRLCRALGGAIEVDSELGKGTTFVVTLPDLDGSQSPWFEEEERGVSAE